MNNNEVIRRRHVWTNDAITDEEATAHDNVSAPDSIDKLKFAPQTMVAWYSPLELVITGFRSAISTIFGAYADKREIEAALWAGEWQDYSDYLEQNGEIWIDYVADLGDGWSPTYTIARLLAEKTLTLEKDGESWTTSRGNILIMGGDQVYPTANLEEYRNRLIGPYSSALPSVPGKNQAPHLFAVPGNHDWYDGLSSFVKLFCQGRWIGAWKTQQKRSYFSFKLADKLWVWGIDIQLNSDIDKPQLDYFEKIAATMKQGSNIILCTAEPVWAYVEMHTAQQTNDVRKENEKEKIYKNLGYLQNKITKNFGHDIQVALAGDTHAYARYESISEPQRQRFVAGGGGAYLYPTHNLPDSLQIPEIFGGEKYSLKSSFPTKDKSRSLTWRSLLFPFYRVNFGFTAFIGGFYLLLAWVMQSASKDTSGSAAGRSLLEKLSVSFESRDIMSVLAHSPGSVTFLVIFSAGLIVFSPFDNVFKKILHGGLHAFAHITLFTGLMTVSARINIQVLGLQVDQPWQVILFIGQMLLPGGVLGAFLFGFYLWLSNRALGVHDNEVLLCQSNPDYKHFLRMQICKNGTMKLFPVGVEKVSRFSWSWRNWQRAMAGWKLNAGAKGSDAWFEPVDGPIQKHAELIEKPVAVSFTARDK